MTAFLFSCELCIMRLVTTSGGRVRRRSFQLSLATPDASCYVSTQRWWFFTPRPSWQMACRTSESRAAARNHTTAEGDEEWRNPPLMEITARSSAAHECMPGFLLYINFISPTLCVYRTDKKPLCTRNQNTLYAYKSRLTMIETRLRVYAL